MAMTIAMRTARIFGWAGAVLLLLAPLVLDPRPGAAAESPQCRPAAAFSVPEQRVEALARGFNLTGWLDSNTPRAPETTVLAELKSRGFTYVRLPVTPEHLMTPFSQPADIAANLAQLDTALDALQSLGFAVSLDIHPGERLNQLLATNPEPSSTLINALWRQLAQRYAGRPADTLFFEVLNEPNFDPDFWAWTGPHLVDTIRSQAPDHTIIYALSKYQRIDALDAHQPLAQPNIVYAVHFYDPMVFTHQGLDWSDDPLRYVHGLPFPLKARDPRAAQLTRELRAEGHDQAAEDVEEALGEGWDAQKIGAAIKEAAAWSARNRAPVIIDEFGVLAWKADPADRIRWLKAVSGSATANCLGWAIWDYAGGFGFVQRVGDVETPDQAVLAALLGEPREGLRKLASP